MTMKSTGLLLFISGPSGVGKSTICRRLARELPASFALSATTRPRKPQDKQAKRYIFIDEYEFRRRRESGDFLEYARVFGHWYGTLRQPVVAALARGRTVLLEIDVQGGRQVSGLFPAAVGIFILPPSARELARRLTSRGRDEPDVIRRRIARAQREIREARLSGAYPHMVMNNELDQTVQTLIRLVRDYQSEAGNSDADLRSRPALSSRLHKESGHPGNSPRGRRAGPPPS
jgi:guanylate kinase